jgi:hypothetical protein
MDETSPMEAEIQRGGDVGSLRVPLKSERIEQNNAVLLPQRRDTATWR